MAPIYKSRMEMATIDVNLVTIKIDSDEFGFDTSNQVTVDPQSETDDAVKLIIKGSVRALKQEETTITGNQITLTDNVFNPELAVAVQGGKIIYDNTDPDKIIGYDPPVSGGIEKQPVFTLCIYTAQYSSSGQIVKYEKTEYPNCQGTPIAYSSEDGAFRAPEYVINSAPDTGEPPYTIRYVDDLPVLTERPPTTP